jgi:putative endonuclease
MSLKIMFVYIMANKDIDPTLYTGVTNNVVRRVQEHKTEQIPGFTKKYHLHNLVYYEIIEGQEQAIIREKQIKNLSRKEKLELIKTVNPKFIDLYFRLGKTII